MSELSWQPSAPLEVIQLRAQTLQLIRDFFAKRHVLEVETPLLCHTSVTDPYIQSIPALFQSAPQQPETRYYLQTSPEYAMKRLLAAGTGAIYQITKAFRQGEVGRLHNPEFTMLEWYQPNMDHHQLMDEMDDLLQLILKEPSAERKTYTTLFNDYLQIDPHHATLAELATCAKQHALAINGEITERHDWLDILMTHCIEPHLGLGRPTFIYDFPVAQAALARIRGGETPPVASRFEVYCHGMELANGFHELQDAAEQRIRFENNVAHRRTHQLPLLPIDEFFMSALNAGLPDCAGVALGLDRLLLAKTHSKHIKNVLPFDFSRI